MKFTAHMARLIEARKSGEASRDIWKYASKMGVRGVAQELGLEVPELYATFGADDWGFPPSSVSGCVLKPADASNQRGVLPLRRAPMGQWMSMLGDGRRTWFDWREWSLRERERHRELGVEPYDGPWMLEELVIRRSSNAVLLLPYDWKCYCIGGRVAWVNQVDKTTSRNARSYRTRHWWRVMKGLKPGGRIIDQPRDEGRLPRPRHEKELLEAADRVAAYLREKADTPFVRVDLYEHDDGRILLGEITPHPSGGRELYYQRADEALGKLWSDIE